MAGPPGPIPGPNEANTSSGSQYIGGVQHARILGYTVPAPFGARIPVQVKGYKKGDQVKLLPPPGSDLATLQRSLISAGYITKAQADRLVFGSPDEVTTTAFAKLLATSNMSGTNWKDTLGQRLAAQALQAPTEDDRQKLPALTVDLDDPVKIKQTVNETARKLLGGYMSDAEADAFVAQFQAAQRTQQTQAYYQKYNVQGTDEHGAPLGYAGPGGTTTTPDMEAQAENYAKTTQPDQYAATQFGTAVEHHLANLRQTGYLS